jgi:uncharacterized integral membrane protein (TIGR00697 family)
MPNASVDASRLGRFARHDYPERFRYYDILVSAFVAVLLISNIVAPKFIAWGPVRLSGAQLLFPLTYIFGDIFTEVYGYAGSRRAIWNGFFASGLMMAISMIIVALPASPDWPYQQAYATVLGFLPRLVVASLIAYWAGAMQARNKACPRCGHRRDPL